MRTVRNEGTKIARGIGRNRSEKEDGISAGGGVKTALLLPLILLSFPLRSFLSALAESRRQTAHIEKETRGEIK